MLTQAPRGTKDILPEKIPAWTFAEQKFRAVCESFGFTEIRTPIIEHTELYERGVGGTTDIVQKQMYTFEDYGGRSITLKPEGTAGVARTFVQDKLYAKIQPTKLWYETTCFRYETPQTGRLREFHQFGIEYFGSDNMLADTEVISLANTFLQSVGLKQIELRINSIGCPKCRPIYREALKAFLKPKYDDLCDTCKTRYETNPMRILDCKSPSCQELVIGAPVMADYLCDECKDAFTKLCANLDAAGIEYIVDHGIVRGLDYYTKTAFEFVTDMIGAQGTVCGGGRYDHLIEEIGGPENTPGVGFGLGIERLLLLMENSGVKPPAPPRVKIIIVSLGDMAEAKGIELLQDIRAAGVSAEMATPGRSLKNQLKYANHVNAEYAAIIGEDEIAQGIATVRNMDTGEQTPVAFADISQKVISHG